MAVLYKPDTWTVKGQLSSNYCAHCRRAIGRKGTYLIVNQDGRTMQVGRTCVKSFITKKPRSVRVIQSLADILADEKHTQAMIEGPDATLTHAMCHLFNTVFFGADKSCWVYRESIRVLDRCRKQIKGEK